MEQPQLSDVPTLSSEFYSSLATKQVAVGCILLDVAGCVLLVEPKYKTPWELPGGSVEANESPLSACRREIYEELGLDRWPKRLLGVDYRRAVDGVRGDALRFVFFGGTLTPAEISLIRLPTDELSEWRFVALDELDAMVIPAMARRIRSCVEASDAVYLEEGAPPNRV